LIRSREGGVSVPAMTLNFPAEQRHNGVLDDAA
jgi:hypothetical protein